jgi:PAT family beta-lactamase induction signal transducer AmpG
MPLLSGLPPQSLAGGAEVAGVSAAALGAGYMSFFLYSFALGLVAIGLAFVVVRESGEGSRAGPAPTEPAPTGVQT